jgi:hypothetical protein
MGEISPFVASVSTRIIRRAGEYTAELDRGGRTEQAALEQFATHAEAILADYDPPSARRHSDSLVFRHLYAAARQPGPDEAGWRVPSAIPAALLAAEIEFRGPLRLSSRQNTMLAEEYEQLGAQLSAARLPGHAALAYRRGAALYRMNEDDEAEDRCGLRLARARTLALPPGPAALDRATVVCAVRPRLPAVLAARLGCRAVGAVHRRRFGTERKYLTGRHRLHVRDQLHQSAGPR